MRFELTEEQAGFGAALDDLLRRADTVAVARAWVDGDHEPGRALWARLADQGLSALLVPEAEGGLGGSAVDLVVAHETLGRHLVVGPWIESSAFLALALDGADRDRVLAGAVATVAAHPQTPYAAHADAADLTFVAEADGLRRVEVTRYRCSFDPTRRLGVVAAGDPAPLGAGFEHAVLACAADLLGSGERVLADTVAYAKQRRQFGREIGSYQALKHALADVRIALDFARPLLFGAALTLSARDVSAAKVACADAATRAARTGLQVHGAIGYTREHDLGLWLQRIRALVGVWGTPGWHRDRILAALREAS